MVAGAAPQLLGMKLTRTQKRAIAVLVVLGGVQGSRQLKKWVKAAQSEQKALFQELQGKSSRDKSKQAAKIAVNKLFLKRLMTILSICVPSPFSREAGLVLLQGGLLISRTLLTEWIAQLEGFCGRSLISLEFDKFAQAVMGFAALGVPAAVVNSGLKFMQKQIELSFQSRLTRYLHAQYTRNRAYYAASTLGGLTHADQRITEDVEKFSFAISELYSHTFKPLLDVILFTRSLARIMGYKGQFGLYAYYMLVAWVLRQLSPPLAQMTAQEAALSGAFRAAHQRLVGNAEEVAFNDPPAGAAEQLILNQHLKRLVRYSSLSAFQRFLQQIADGYTVKYLASCVALLVYAAPIYFKAPEARGTQGQLTSDYIRSMRLLQNTSRGVGDLILIYKRISNLASHTSRVAELLEQVRQLSSEDVEHRELFRRNVSATALQDHADAAAAAAAAGAPPPPPPGSPPPSPRRVVGDRIAFSRVALDAPDGTPLLRDLSFEVLPGCSVMLMGPNGCGKSSLFRVLAGLWPLQAGLVTTPPKRQLFYLSQRPYLVAGSLRDQLLYPLPPRTVWAAADAKEQVHYTAIAGQQPVLDAAAHARLQACLKAVELDYLLQRGSGWDHVQPWAETLSGGEKQRLAMARLLFHRPQFAILDECTSAVAVDGEAKLYEACVSAGITLLSIAHRPALKRFHQMVVHVDGGVSATGGTGWWLERLGGHAAGGGSSGGGDSGTGSGSAATSARGGGKAAVGRVTR